MPMPGPSRRRGRGRPHRRRTGWARCCGPRLEGLAGLDAPVGWLRRAVGCAGTAIIEGRGRLPCLEPATALLRQVGAPWRTGIDALPARAREAHLELSERVTFGEMVRGL